MIALGICRRHTTVDSGTHSHRHTARERAQRAARTFICVRLVPPGAWPLYLLLSLTVNQTRETRVARDWTRLVTWTNSWTPPNCGQFLLRSDENTVEFYGGYTRTVPCTDCEKLIP